LCGDGVVTSGEACDDGNADPSDGCDNCQITPGFYCGSTPGKCCFAADFYDMVVNQLHLVCDDGWWVAADGSSNIDLTGVTTGNKRYDASEDFADREHVLLDHDYLQLCGTIVLEEEWLEVTADATFIIAGSIVVNNGGVLTLHDGGDHPIILIEPVCSAITIPEDGKHLNQGFLVNQGGVVEVVMANEVTKNANPHTDQTDLIPFISAYGCSNFYGEFRYDAPSIPQENNYYPLTYSYGWTNCTFTADTSDVLVNLPSCPIILLQVEDESIVIVTATHRMCAGAIAGITVGITAAAIAGVAALALLGGASSAGAAPSAYVAL